MIDNYYKNYMRRFCMIHQSNINDYYLRLPLLFHIFLEDIYRFESYSESHL